MQNIIYRALKKHSGCKRFFMPGHKASNRFKKYFANFAELDVTELSFSDNLQNPQTILKKSQAQAAKLFGFACAFFLTGGATSGIFAALNYIKRKNMRLAILKNSHVSVYNACEAMEIDVVIFDSAKEFYLKTNLYDAACLTNIDYLGTELQIDWKFFGENGKFLFVDGAHSITCKEHESFAYCDAMVVSCHKLLPCFTQSAILLVKSDESYKEFLEAKNMVSTTSPSYLIMASIEYAIMRLAKDDSKERLLKLKKTHLAEFERYIVPSDYLRIVFDVGSLCDARFLQKELEKRGIFAEFASRDRILFLLGLDTNRDDFVALRNTLRDIIPKCEKPSKVYNSQFTIHNSQFVLSYLEARKSPKELVPQKDSIGRICAKNVGNFPPAIPIICAGEIITEVALTELENSCFGIIDGKIEVIN